MLIAVTGGTGMVGREAVAALAARGHAVRSLSRGAPAALPPGVEHRRVDLLSGEGLRAALEGVDAVVDAANGGPRRSAAEAVLLRGGRRLLAAGRDAGVRHHVAVSIVGIDRVPVGYYGVKREHEALVQAGPLPWTILRATQFHPLVAGLFAATARAGVLPGPAFPLQPVDPREVAAAMADTVEGGASGEVRQIAGPEVAGVRVLAHTWRRVTGRRALVVPLPLVGTAARALADGGLTNPQAPRGRVTFEAWLRERGHGAAGGRAVGSAPERTAESVRR